MVSIVHVHSCHVSQKGNKNSLKIRTKQFENEGKNSLKMRAPVLKKGTQPRCCSVLNLPNLMNLSINNKEKIFGLCQKF